MATPLKFGATVYLKNHADAISNRWLSGCRDLGNTGVRTDDKTKELDDVAKKYKKKKEAGEKKKEEVLSTYKWQIYQRWDYVGDTGKSIMTGDIVYLKCLWGDGKKWLSGGRGPGNGDVITKTGGNQFGSSFEWRIFKDTSKQFGQPINVGDTVFLFIGVVDNPDLWLSGARGIGNKSVRTKDKQDKTSTFQWHFEAV
jgi:hypothetical protein